MPAPPVSVSPEVVRKIAELARLRVNESELPLWSEQLSRIVSYVGQINEIPEEAFGDIPPVPPTPMRIDRPRPGDGLSALEANAPRSLHGFGVVPRVVGSGE